MNPLPPLCSSSGPDLGLPAPGAPGHHGGPPGPGRRRQGRGGRLPHPGGGGLDAAAAS